MAKHKGRGRESEPTSCVRLFSVQHRQLKGPSAQEGHCLAETRSPTQDRISNCSRYSGPIQGGEHPSHAPLQPICCSLPVASPQPRYSRSHLLRPVSSLFLERMLLFMYPIEISRIPKSHVGGILLWPSVKTCLGLKEAQAEN